MRTAIPALLFVLAFTAAARGQTTDSPPAERLPTIDELPPLDLEPESRGAGVSYDLRVGAGMQSGGSEFDVFRAHATVGASTRLSKQVDLRLSFGYEFDNYDFDMDSFFGNDVWDQVHTYGVRANFDIKIDSDWTLFVGPVFQVSHESGAEFDESWIAGGFAGLTYQVEPGVTIGGGVGITSQLQDRARLQPIIILDWEISSDVRLTSRTEIGLTGVSLVFDLYEKFDIGLGIAYVFKRFRMDDTGIVPGGIGQETSLPVYISGTYTLGPSSTITAYAGVVLSGEIELENRDGGKLTDEYDPMALFGLSVALEF